MTETLVLTASRDRAAVLAVALGCLLSGGVFFAFSAFVLPALDALPPGQAVAAMQSMNVKAVTPAFMALLFGTGLACAALGGWALLHRSSPGAWWIVAGCAVFLAGAIGVTAAGNVPLNDALAAVPASGADQGWLDFAGRWSALNHVRTVSCAAAGVLLGVGALA